MPNTNYNIGYEEGYKTAMSIVETLLMFEAEGKLNNQNIKELIKEDIDTLLKTTLEMIIGVI